MNLWRDIPTDDRLPDLIHVIVGVIMGFILIICHRPIPGLEQVTKPTLLLMCVVVL